MRVGFLLLPLISAIGLMPLSAFATGMPELPPELPILTLPDAVSELGQLPDLPDLGELFPGPEAPDHPSPPELSVPLGPPSPLPPEGLPPGLMLGPPDGLPGRGPARVVPEPGTALLVGIGLFALGRSVRARQTV